MSDSEVKATLSQKNKTKRVKADLDCSTNEKHFNTAGEMQELDAELDLIGLTMAEKLASLELIVDGEAKNATEKEAPSLTNIPSVDSLHVLLKQAIHAQDQALLAECLSTTDEKVITNSTALLNPSDVLMLLKSLLPLLQLRYVNGESMVVIMTHGFHLSTTYQLFNDRMYGACSKRLTSDTCNSMDKKSSSSTCKLHSITGIILFRSELFLRAY